MTWKPKPPIAALLGLFTTPLGMLYVQRPGLAALYFALSVVAAVTAFFSMWAFGSDIISLLLFATGWLISIACAVHAYRIAKDGSAIAERKWYSRWHALVGIWAVAFLAVFLTRCFVFEPFRIPSVSMHPGIPQGTVVIVEKWGFGHYGSYGVTPWRGAITKQIQRGDIVVHVLVEDPSVYYIRRIIGLPGDHVSYSDRQLTINGQLVPVTLRDRDDAFQYATERFDDRDVEIVFMPERHSKDFDAVVPPGQYMMFGDNRDNARDSRFTGAIPQANIVGRVTKIIRPRS